MEFLFVVMILVSNVVIIVLSSSVIYFLEKLVKSKYRNCSAYVTMDQDQFENLIFVLNEIARLN